MFLVSLVVARVVTVTGPKRLGVSMKLSAAALLVVAISLESVLSPVALGILVAAILVALVVAERVLLPPPRWAAR